MYEGVKHSGSAKLQQLRSEEAAPHDDIYVKGL